MKRTTKIEGELLHNCRIMLSRIEAMLVVPEAVAALCAEDVFGKDYEKLLRADVRELKKVIRHAEKQSRLTSTKTVVS